jgi:NAD-dependent deacetylase
MDAIEAGDDDPRCPDCSGITKAATAMFGQSLPEATLAAAVDATTRCDLFLAIGTSLSVHPAAGLPRLATEHGATLAICNAESTPLDALADLVVRDPLGDVLPAAVDRALGG